MALNATDSHRDATWLDAQFVAGSAISTAHTAGYHGSMPGDCECPIDRHAKGSGVSIEAMTLSDAPRNDRQFMAKRVESHSGNDARAHDRCILQERFRH